MRVLSRRRFSVFLLLGLVAAYCIWAGVFIRRSYVPLYSGGGTFCLGDDAMISLRYAQNLVRGHGLVWNPGERVEGYTNPLMVLVMALALALLPTSPAIFAIQLFGLLLVVMSAFLARGIYLALAGRSRVSETISLVVAAAVLAYYPLSFWALTGMETGLATVLLLAAVAMALPGPQGKDGRRAWALGVVLALLYLTRPDTLLYAALLLYLQWMVHGRRPAGAVWRPALVLAMVVAGHFAFRLLYYGEILPNTAVLRLQGFPLGFRLLGGIGYSRPLLQVLPVPVLLALLSCLQHRDDRRLIMLLIFAVSLAYQIYVGGDPRPYQRFVTPAVPLLLVLAADGAVSTTAWLLSLIRLRARVREVFSVAIAFLLLVRIAWQLNYRFLPEVTFAMYPYEIVANRHHVNTAIAIREFTRPTATVGVIWAGVIPFFSERKAVDFLGKNDKRIARLPPDLSGSVSRDGMWSVPAHNKYDLIYPILRLRPTYIQNTRWGRQNLSGWASNHYVRVNFLRYSLLFLRDSPDVLWDRIAALTNQSSQSRSRHPL